MQFRRVCNLVRSRQCVFEQDSLVFGNRLVSAIIHFHVLNEEQSCVLRGIAVLPGAFNPWR